MYDETMNSAENVGNADGGQYCLEEKIAPSSFAVQFSPSADGANSSGSWWTTIKADVTSPKDSWSSDDSECSSQQTMICSENDMGNLDGTSSSLGTSDDSAAKKRKKGKETAAVNKPAQVVARRNARERRRVQQVNGAFQRLRKVVPLEENKSKRMSKVKTLQLAIEYINQLQNLLQYTTQHSNEADLLADIFSDLQQQQNLKLEPSDYSFRVPTSFYNHMIGENEEN